MLNKHHSHTRENQRRDINVNVDSCITHTSRGRLTDCKRKFCLGDDRDLAADPPAASSSSPSISSSYMAHDRAEDLVYTPAAAVFKHERKTDKRRYRHRYKRGKSAGGGEQTNKKDDICRSKQFNTCS